ncbi:hypothetical protein [Mesorhizobium sp. CN2-181]|uniref:hypothetical protein n=1 Tax=Mesorhizobium yinganensis TaxID=3157707 RepID=UPI0032B75E12
MDGTAAIERNWEALKRLLAMLVGMAELGVGGQFTLFPQKGAAASRQVLAEKSKLSPALTLPRHLYRAILRLLLPAEAAARRLIIAAARGIVVAAPRFRPRKARPTSASPLLSRLGIAVTMSRADLRRAAAAKRAAALRAARPRSFSLPLLDPLPRPFRPCRRREPTRAAPRISAFDIDTRLGRLPPPPSPDDPVDAARLALRLGALASALDDLPAQARRFARWKARRDAALARKEPAGGGFRRIWPLRSGRLPGGRLSRYDPSAIRRPNIREVDEILAHAHALAFYALERPDTS